MAPSNASHLRCKNALEICFFGMVQINSLFDHMFQRALRKRKKYLIVYYFTPTTITHEDFYVFAPSFFFVQEDQL